MRQLRNYALSLQTNRRQMSEIYPAAHCIPLNQKPPYNSLETKTILKAEASIQPAYSKSQVGDSNSNSVTFTNVMRSKTTGMKIALREGGQIFPKS